VKLIAKGCTRTLQRTKKRLTQKPPKWGHTGGLGEKGDEARTEKERGVSLRNIILGGVEKENSWGGVGIEQGEARVKFLGRSKKVTL